jgi:inhibitor of KinA sporulation pathway (predicted exonuclease)
MNYKKLIVFDMEMCCWNDGRKPSTGEIIEISFAIIDIETLTVSKRVQFYVKPDNDLISPECEELTGISQSKINKMGRPLVEVMSSIKKSVGGKKSVFASWGRDDLYLFNECNNKGISEPFYENINIATLYGIKHQTNSHSISLDNALKEYGLKFEGRKHSAHADAYNLAKLYIEMNKK